MQKWLKNFFQAKSLAIFWVKDCQLFSLDKSSVGIKKNIRDDKKKIKNLKVFKNLYDKKI